LGQGPVQVQGKFPGRLIEEESEESLAKLKLLLEGKLVQSLNLKLLAEMKVDSSLVRLEFLLGQREIESLKSLKLLVELKMGSFLVKLELLLEEEVIGSLAKLKFLLEQEMIEPLVNLGKKSPWVDSLMFLLQILNKE
jgi:hypothetical protein